MVLTPGRAANHPPVPLPVAAGQPRQPHPGHVEQSNLPVVVGKGDDPLANTHVNPAQKGQKEPG